ncbi:MAG: phage integrase N-terminal SAM-like domain-containing protein [Methylococcales bacterium]
MEWYRRFFLFRAKRHPADLGKLEVEVFLTDLAVIGRVWAATQNQAKSEILFLHREVLDQELPWLDDLTKARESRRLPVVLADSEVSRSHTPARECIQSPISNQNPVLYRPRR